MYLSNKSHFHVDPISIPLLHKFRWYEPSNYVLHNVVYNLRIEFFVGNPYGIILYDKIFLTLEYQIKRGDVFFRKKSWPPELYLNPLSLSVYFFMTPSPGYLITPVQLIIESTSFKIFCFFLYQLLFRHFLHQLCLTREVWYFTHFFL